jgi:mxaD protein
MKHVLPVLTLLAVSACAPSGGDAPVLTVTKSIDVAAPASAVWDVVKDFDALNRWHPAVARTEIVEGSNNAVGAVRVLTLGDGGTVREKLLAYEADGRSMTYSILEGVLPVSDYESTITVAENGGTASTVTWSGSFRRKDTGPTPAAGADDAAATGTMESVYQGGLDNLKRMAEAQ